jgi:NitT/TauT family transport system substrate-binding protein
MKRRLVLCENMRAVPYVPFYLALAGGYWQTEGLDIDHVVSPAASNTPLMLLSGHADVSWGGPMRVMMHHDADPRCPLVCFAQVVARDPFVLVGRGQRPNFRFQDLNGLRVGPANDVPTPWMTFQDDLQRAGLDPHKLAGRRLRPMARNLRAFTRGEIDVVQVYEPYADELVSQHGGSIWHRFTERGDIGYSTFYATRRTTQRRRDDCIRLVAGMNRAQKALHRTSAASLAQAIAEFLPDLGHEALTRMIDNYRSAELWSRSPELPMAAFLRLKAALVSGGLINSDAPYERIIEASLCLPQSL